MHHCKACSNYRNSIQSIYEHHQILKVAIYLWSFSMIHFLERQPQRPQHQSSYFVNKDGSGSQNRLSPPCFRKWSTVPQTHCVEVSELSLHQLYWFIPGHVSWFRGWIMEMCHMQTSTWECRNRHTTRTHLIIRKLYVQGIVLSVLGVVALCWVCACLLQWAPLPRYEWWRWCPFFES